MIKIKEFGWGICVNFTKKQVEVSFKNKKKETLFNNQLTDGNPSDLSNKSVETYFLDVILYVKNTLENDMKLVKGDLSKNDGQMGIVSVFLNSIEEISQVKVNIPQDLKSKENLKMIEKMHMEILKRFSNEIPLLDPIEDMGIENPKLEENIKKKKYLLEKYDSLNVNEVN